ncbi:hypothetical protein Q8A73_012646 [Channa argus]|nr:hypothetical protein Q8A73_012646 [Channa argus]
MSLSLHSVTPASYTFWSSNVSNSSLYPIHISCHRSISGAIIFSLFAFTNILFIFPIHILVLVMGVQRWRNQRSVHGVKQINHSDLFTCHMAAVECIGILGLVFLSYGICTNSERIITVSIYLFCLFFPGETLFHCLTCVERYVAVVHPTIYLRQREKGSVRLRNISIGCVWLICFEGLVEAGLHHPHFPTDPFLCLLCFSLIVVFYCSLSVLRILIRPGPGDTARDRDGSDQSKHRAFRIILAIMGALLLRFVGFFVCFGLSDLVFVVGNLCVLINSGIWLSLPSSLILPLLFLHKAGKLPCCRRSTESG